MSVESVERTYTCMFLGVDKFPDVGSRELPVIQQRFLQYIYHALLESNDLRLEFVLCDDYHGCQQTTS